MMRQSLPLVHLSLEKHEGAQSVAWRHLRQQ
jgi:hypothetical protein